jgi:RHS repeat-associated protein
MRTRRCGGISADLTFLVLFWSSKKVQRKNGRAGSVSMSLELFGTFSFKRKSTKSCGFTGHEHYPELKIINMNSRLYDPAIGRFFSPDMYVQDPEYTQSYNRYSYALNNPLKYIDPTGQWYDDYDCDWYHEWDVNVSTGDVKKVGTKGGDETQYINFVDDFGNLLDQFTYKGNTFDSNWKLDAGGMAEVLLSKTYGGNGDGLNFGSALIYSNSFYVGAPIALPAVEVTATRPDNYSISHSYPVEAGITYSAFNIEDIIGIGMAVKAVVNVGMKMFGTNVAKEAGGGLPTQMHHFATNKHSLYTPLMEDVVRPLGFELNGAWNKALMPHVGRHPNKYHEFVLDRIIKASNAAGGNQAKFLQLYNNTVVQPVIDNPLMLRKVGWPK